MAGDSNMVIDFPKFLSIMTKKNNNDVEELLEAFKVFDKDGNGLISIEEFKHLFTVIGEKINDAELDEMIKEAKTNENGYIYYEELVRRMLAI